MRKQSVATGQFVASSLAEHLAAHTEQVPFHECWEWTGSVFPSGYGNVMFERHNIRAHRAAYEVRHGPIPKGLYVCHRCDNRSCVNPDHLFLGTAQDNERDKIAKGRRGKVGRTTYKLHSYMIPDILRRRAEGESFRSIARLYGVTHEALRGRLSRLEG